MALIILRHLFVFIHLINYQKQIKQEHFIMYKVLPNIFYLTIYKILYKS